MNAFSINYTKKTLSLKYNSEVFNFNLNDGDVGDFWHSFTTKDGVIKDINFYQEDERQKPSVGVYGVVEVDGELTIDTNDSEYITTHAKFGKMKNYFK